MTVMDVGIVRVRMLLWRVVMRMAVRLSSVPLEVVLVPVMLVVRMRMLVVLRLVAMPVLVALREMQPHAKRHERARDPEAGRRRFIE